MKKHAALEQVQRLALHCQGLTQHAPFGTGKNGVLKAVEHLGYVQIDTLSIVERAHHHSLWTRIPDYQPHNLDALIEEREIFEYWFHAASYLPMQDFRYALPQMLRIKQNEAHYYNPDPKIMRYVLDTIRMEGPKKVKDFENKKEVTKGWWNWKPMKVALERLFLQGDLMISGRKGMQKIYDISERVLPAHIDVTMPTPTEEAQYLVRTHLRAYGVTSVKQIMHLRTGNLLKENVLDVLRNLVTEGEIQQLDMHGTSMFVQHQLLETDFNEPVDTIHILSPFDNSIIHRDRIKQLFNFDFRLECYLPKEKRQFGYFCLPLLFGNTFIGRIDCKAHRNSKKFEIIHLHIEKEDIAIEVWIKPFVKLIQRFSIFNGCDSVVLTKVSPSKFENIIKAELFNSDFYNA